MNRIIKLGIAGLGTVGSATVKLLEENAKKLSQQCSAELKLVAVSARNKIKERNLKLDDVKWYDDPIALAKSKDIDIFIELIGGEDGIAKQAIEAALEANHHIVSANKALFARHGCALAEIAEKKGLILNFEAAVAGGIPIIKIMKDSLIANRVKRIYGILNGTCNYILTRMADEHISFEECLKEAQRLGYAEADPSFDINGLDTAQKLALLSSLAFNVITSDKDVYVEGIKHICLDDIKAAKSLGYQIKLLAVAALHEDSLELRVHPTLVRENAQLAKVDDVTNAILLQTNLLGSLFISGPGAGGAATASAIISDIADIAKSCPEIGFRPVFSTSIELFKPHKKKQTEINVSGYFLRLVVQDKAGVFARVAQRMADHNISLESILQRPVYDKYANDEKMIILATHKATESSILKVLQEITNDGYLMYKPQMIRIENFS